MREYKRRVWPGVMVVLSLLAGAGAPVPALADAAAPLTEAPDLAVEAITWSPELPLIGDTVTFTVTIGNQGSEPAGPSRVAYYIDDIYQSSAAINSIGSGAAATGAFTWKAQAGPHIVKAVADAEGQVSESDETNNDGTFAFSVLAPDLAIEAITWSPELPSVGDAVTFTVTIKNQGSSISRCSRVALYVDGNYRGYRELPRIEAGATVTEAFTWPAQVGSHTVRAEADVLSHVDEGDETNNDKTVTCSTATPDFIIQGITWSPADPSENTTVTFTVTVANQGSGRAEHSQVAFYVDDDYQGSAFVSQLSPGATAAKTFTWTAAAGMHTVRAVADHGNQVIESDETNNDKAVDMPALAPDLIIQDITWSPSSPLIDHRVTFTVTVRNQGKTAAGYFRVYLYIDGSRICGLDVRGVNAGAAVTAGIYTLMAQKASYVVRAVADGDDTVTEGSETNNTKTVTVALQRLAQADLIVQDIAWSPESPSTGEAVNVTVTVKNRGSAQAGSSRVACYADDGYYDSILVDPMASGATATRTFTWTARSGPHIFRAVADAGNHIFESDENNNEKAVSLTLPAPDLVIQDITWSPVIPSAGDVVNFNVTVRNRGGVGAGGSCLAYYLDGSYRGYHDVPGIEPGATATRTFTWTAQSGPHTFRVVADAENAVFEGDEANNERAVSLPAPDLVIQDIAWSPAGPSENTTVTFTVTVKNRGGGSAGASGVDFYVDDIAIGCENVPATDAGVTVARTFVWDARAGAHTVRAVADGENRVTESVESNNEQAVAFPVLSPLPAAPIAGAGLAPQEAGAPLDEQDSDVSPVSDTASNSPEKSPSAATSEKGIWLNWWVVLAAAVVLGCAVSLVILRFRQRQKGPQSDVVASNPSPT